MCEVIKKSQSGIDIYDYTGKDYKTVMSYDKWRVAYLNHGKEFNETTLTKIERHMESDEVFVLLEGEATLIIGEALDKIPMEQHKVYNVPKGVWHHILVSKEAKVLIVENVDTKKDNTEFIYLDK